MRKPNKHGKRRKLIAAVLLLVFIFAGIPVLPVSAAPYEGYTYSYWGEAVPSPIAYTPSAFITGGDLGIGALVTPLDMFVSPAGLLYLLDSGNGRIIVLDDRLQLQQVIDGFEQNGQADSFNKPEGLFVTLSGTIMVADTENSRLIELQPDGTFIREIGSPKSEVLSEGFTFFPRKVVVDKAGRIYVVARGVYDGIIELDMDGDFTGFIGTNKVKFDPLDYFWKSVSTKEQREKMIQFIPIEFNNIDLDDSGFIYTTTFEKNSNSPIQKLNPTGIDVLRRQGYFFPVGDLTISGSSFTDVLVGNHGVYSALDTSKGRIFTYNEDGNLLYIIGQMGHQLGSFRSPVAIEGIGDRMLVLDRDLGALTVFEPTRFGHLVNEANRLYSIGNHDESAEVWEQVLALDANYEIAYIGIGKSLLRQGKYKQAMEYLKLGHDRTYYSKAFAKYRREYMRDNFGIIMTSLLSVAVLAVAGRVLWHAKRGKGRGKTHAV